MQGDTYVPGVVVLAQSLKRVSAAYPLICMHTTDVTADALALLARHVILVPVEYISHPTKKLATAKQREMYGAWINYAFTQANFFGLYRDYDKIVYLHSDILVRQNIDHLFDVAAPAGCWSTPFVKPFGSAPNYYLDQYKLTHATAIDLPQGTAISPALAYAGLTQAIFTMWSACVVIEPTADDLEQFKALLAATPIYGSDFKVTISGPDEVSIVEYYARLGKTFTHLNQAYIAIPRKPEWFTKVGRSINEAYAYHYYGTNVWELGRDEWPDTKAWWDVADTVTDPSFQRWLGGPSTIPPTDGDKCYAEYRMRRDILNNMYTIVQGRKRSDASPSGETKRKAGEEKVSPIDNIIERWLLAMAQLPPQASWSVVYRILPPSHPIHLKLRDELRSVPGATAAIINSVVDQALRTIQARLSRNPAITNQQYLMDETDIRYGSRFSTPWTVRLRFLYKLNGDLGALVCLAMRYATVISGGQQWGLPRGHFGALHRYGVNFEAYASPLNSRLLPLGGSYGSLFPDTDRIYGSLGPFESLRMVDLPGHIEVNPPFVESILLAAAVKVTRELPAIPERKVFFLGPVWSSAEFFQRLESYPYKVIVDLAPGSFSLETPNGQDLTPSSVALRYWCLAGKAMSPEEMAAVRELMRTGVK